MLTIHKLFKIYGIDPTCVKLVRHGNKEIPILDTFQTDISRFVSYQSFQMPKKFGKAKTIAVFAPYHKTTALFLGLWNIENIIKNSEFTTDISHELKKQSLPKEWFESSDKYILNKNNILKKFSERLVIEWGRSTVSWVQNKDKEIIEIKSEQTKLSIGEFEAFDTVSLSLHELKKIINSPEINPTWVTALSSVNGVYLIQDKTTGKLYVGSAYGDNGIYGRWATYSKNGHGGNKILKEVNPNNFQFSILEIVSATTTADGVINCENKWKEKLGSRKFGNNEN